jgi:hypothetical protein
MFISSFKLLGFFWEWPTSYHHEELAFRFQMNTADASAQATAPNARYVLKLS